MDPRGRPDQFRLDEPPAAEPPHRPPTLPRRAAPFLAGAASVVLVGAVVFALQPPEPRITDEDVTNAIASALASQTPGPANSELVYEAVRASLVLIQTGAAATEGNGPQPSASPGHQRGEGGGSGSGVIIDQRGQILTALHVVAGADEISVTFADATTTGAVVVASDPSLDIAVLQVESLSPNVAPAILGNPGALRIGSEAYVVGNPFGLYGTLTVGVVSGLERTFVDPETDERYEGLIQVDAAVNPGSSGGPLLDRAGHVVGIVTALLNPTGDDVFVGIGLAVPITLAGGAAGAPPY
jgi:S1-C subfamily serine protease